MPAWALMSSRHFIRITSGNGDAGVCDRACCCLQGQRNDARGSNHSSCYPIVDDARVSPIVEDGLAFCCRLFLEVLQLVEEEFHSAQM